MDPVHIPHDATFAAKGPCWSRMKGERAPLFRCRCGARSLMKDHHVDAAGVVTASIACRVPTCDFHVMGILDDWTGTYP